MHQRWLILAVLTLVRTTMGFQFQGIAALGAYLTNELTFSYTALGTLMGIYLLPGALFALPGGWFGSKFGDKKMVLIGMAMMTFGGAMLALSKNFEVMIIGRLVSGIGAILLNVLVTKMVTDWFAGQRIVLAMGILISSWPLGIAIALLIMGPLAESFGLSLAFSAPVALCSISILLVAAIYTPPDTSQNEATEVDCKPRYGLSRYEFWGCILSGCVWCFYNIALILPLSFGPDFLIAQGVEYSIVGAITSLTGWLIIPALPLGSWFAERLGKPYLIMIPSFVAIAVVTWLIPLTSWYAVMFALLGILFGLAGGLIMALPAQVLQVENRAVGMGIFFTVYYMGMGIGSSIAGYARDASGDPAAPLWMAGLTILIALLALIGFRILLLNPPANFAVK
jgi:predicted MFS family arabinose efflux permease